jgi:hypothetical protein
MDKNDIKAISTLKREERVTDLRRKLRYKNYDLKEMNIFFRSECKF